MGAWQAAIDAGIVTVLSDLLVVDEEPTVVSLLTLLSWLMLATPAGTAGAWGRGLPRAVAGLLISKRLVVPARAVNILSMMALTQKGLLVDYQSWGLGDVVQRLTRHRDPETAAAAEHLLSAIDNGIEVSYPLLDVSLFA
jgi:hypothetical protein